MFGDHMNTNTAIADALSAYKINLRIETLLNRRCIFVRKELPDLYSKYIKVAGKAFDCNLCRNFVCNYGCAITYLNGHLESVMFGDPEDVNNPLAELAKYVVDTDAPVSDFDIYRNNGRYELNSVGYKTRRTIYGEKSRGGFDHYHLSEIAKYDHMQAEGQELVIEIIKVFKTLRHNLPNEDQPTSINLASAALNKLYNHLIGLNTDPADKKFIYTKYLHEISELAETMPFVNAIVTVLSSVEPYSKVKNINFMNASYFSSPRMHNLVKLISSIQNDVLNISSYYDNYMYINDPNYFIDKAKAKTTNTKCLAAITKLTELGAIGNFNMSAVPLNELKDVHIVNRLDYISKYSDDTTKLLASLAKMVPGDHADDSVLYDSNELVKATWADLIYLIETETVDKILIEVPKDNYWNTYLKPEEGTKSRITTRQDDNLVYKYFNSVVVDSEKYGMGSRSTGKFMFRVDAIRLLDHDVAELITTNTEEYQLLLPKLTDRILPEFEDMANEIDYLQTSISTVVMPEGSPVSLVVNKLSSVHMTVVVGGKSQSFIVNNI